MTLRRLLETPIADLAFDDIEALIQEEAEEGSRLELKRELPANDRQSDPWMQGGKKFANPARDGLAKEVVALANAYGGVIVVGVDETDDHPKRAAGPEPILIPRIAECAERMLQALDSLIDPPLPVLEVRGIEKPDSDGHGVLVIRTGASTRAPHGYGRPPAAYMRRGSRSEPMTMRDLQSVLFETRTRGERTLALLDERHIAFKNMAKGDPGDIVLDRESPFAGQEVLYFRCTLVATEDLQVRTDTLGSDGWFRRPRPPHIGVPAFGDDTFSNRWQPRLRGVESIDWASRHFARWFLGDQGIVDAYGFLTLDTYKNIDDAFPPGVFPPVAIQVLALGETLRRAARRPEVELVLECEFINPNRATALYSDGRPSERGVEIPSGSIRIGPFTLGNIEDFQTVYAEVERSIWNALGLHVGKTIVFPMQQWLHEMGLG